MITIIGIDPGTSHLGIAYINVNEEYKIQSIIAETLHVDKLARVLNVPSTATSELPRHERAKFIILLLKQCFSWHDPVAVAIESPFINSKRPAAYGALVETMSIIRSSLQDVQPLTPVVLYEPSIVKQAMGGKATGNKQDMLNALNALEELKQYVQFDALDEHSNDAVAVAFTHLMQIRLHRNQP